jgi:hypothetical protein
MRRNAAQGLLAAAVLAACLTGCTGNSRQTYPSDPLFINKKPIEAKVDNAAPTAVAQLEPAVPQVPALVVAATRRAPVGGAPVPGQASGPPAATPLPPPPRVFTPTSHTPGPASVP